MIHTVQHPAPGRNHISTIRHFTGFIGAPAAWVMQMSLGYLLTSNACYPRQKPLVVPLWDWFMPALGLLNMTCLIFASLAACIAWTGWRRMCWQSGNEKHVINAGEGRARFSSMLGLLTSGIFLAGTLFTGCAMLLVSPCHGEG